jgi:hypothetical protein
MSNTDRSWFPMLLSERLGERGELLERLPTFPDSLF